MSIFDDALAAARGAVKTTFARPMTITAMLVSDYKGAVPDASRPAYTIDGVLHEHATGRGGSEEPITERSDGQRPGGRFGVDLVAAPTRISLDVADLAHGIPDAGTVITLADARRFEVLRAAPPNGGRVFLYVTELV